METVNIYDAMHVSFSNKYGYPFNLKFERTIKDSRVKGPGVYVIYFKGNPVILVNTNLWIVIIFLMTVG